MFAIKPGYHFIAVNFGGYQLCKTVAEARTVAANMKPEPGLVWVREWYSCNLGRTITTETWVRDRSDAEQIAELQERVSELLEVNEKLAARLN